MSTHVYLHKEGGSWEAQISFASGQATSWDFTIQSFLLVVWEGYKEENNSKVNIPDVLSIIQCTENANLLYGIQNSPVREYRFLCKFLKMKYASKNWKPITHVKISEGRI